MLLAATAGLTLPGAPALRAQLPDDPALPSRWVTTVAVGVGRNVTGEAWYAESLTQSLRLSFARRLRGRTALEYSLVQQNSAFIGAFGLGRFRPEDCVAIGRCPTRYRVLGGGVALRRGFGGDDRLSGTALTLGTGAYVVVPELRVGTRIAPGVQVGVERALRSVRGTEFGIGTRVQALAVPGREVVWHVPLEVTLRMR